MYEVSLAQQAYEATPEFQTYWTAYGEWLERHAEYCSVPNDRRRSALIAAQEHMMGLLEKARQTPEHKAAFGW